MKILESLLPKLFITLVPSNAGVYLYAELCKNGKVKKRFDMQVAETMEQLANKIKIFERECSVSYIALLETEASQGVLPECRESELVDSSSVEKICIDHNRWGCYIAKDDLFDRQRSYKSIGLDFLFSPFALLHAFYQENMIEHDGLYLLVMEGSVFGMVFKNGQLLFGEQRRVEGESSLLNAYVDAIQSIIKAFYDVKADDTMFIENIYIADAHGFEEQLEERLEAVLFTSVEKRDINVSHELVRLSEKELS